MRQFHAMLLAAVLLAAPAPGRTSTPSAGDDAIVVSGQRAEQAKAAATQARAVTQPAPAGKPLARHYVPICVRVFGLGDPYAQAVAERVTGNVRSLGLLVGGTGCQPNAWIGLVSNSRSQVAELRKREPAMFASLKRHEIERIFRGSSAVQAWHATEIKGVDGRPIPVVRMPDGSEYEINQQFKAGRLTSTIRVDFTGSIVLFDRKLVGSRSLGQLADYATMRLLAATYDQAGLDPNVPTILSLFATADGAPDALTEFDRAYLKALYRLGPGADHRDMHDAVRSAFLRGMGAEN